MTIENKKVFNKATERGTRRYKATRYFRTGARLRIVDFGLWVVGKVSFSAIIAEILRHSAADQKDKKLELAPKAFGARTRTLERVRYRGKRYKVTTLHGYIGKGTGYRRIE